MLFGGPRDGDTTMLSGPADCICPGQELSYANAHLTIGGVDLGWVSEVEIGLARPPFYVRRGPASEDMTTYCYDYALEAPGARPKMATGEEPKCRAP